MSFQLRLKHELKEIANNPNEGIRLNIDESDTRNWRGEIDGPEGTAYHNFVLRLKIRLSDNYPFTPPTVTFEHPVYHPNVGSGGNICLDILNSQWSPTYNLFKTMLSVCALLSDPNPKSPLNSEAAKNWENNRDKYFQEAIRICTMHCKKN